jgi:predicted component of type VI protein secretion system
MQWVPVWEGGKGNMAAVYRLIIRSGPSAGKVYDIEQNELTIGRDLNNEVVISDPEVSRRHARLYLQGPNYVLEDLVSTNGTFVNGQRLMGPYVLRPGEVITLGEHISLEFEAGAPDPDATVASASIRPPEPMPAARSTPPPPPVAQYNSPQQSAPPPRPVSPQPTPMYNQSPLPPPGYEEPFVPERRFPSWAIVLIIVLLFLVCVCAVALYIVDARNMWCDLFPFLFSACR